MAVGCVLKGLSEPRLVSALPGLRRDDQGFILDTKQFACCDATGCRLDFATNTTTRCDLKPRLAAVSALLGAYGRWWDFASQPLTPDSGLRVSAADLKTLAAIGCGESVKGRYVDAEMGVTPGRQLWSVALAAAWRFGLAVHVVTMGKANATEHLPKPLPAGRRGIIIVENVIKISDPHSAEQLEALISYAYGAGLPLWLEVWRYGKAVQGAVTGTRSVSHRVAAAKNRPPLDWLTEAARRKLTEVCAVPASALPMPAAKRQKAGKSRPDDVRLPWET